MDQKGQPTTLSIDDYDDLWVACSEMQRRSADDAKPIWSALIDKLNILRGSAVAADARQQADAAPLTDDDLLRQFDDQCGHMNDIADALKLRERVGDYAPVTGDMIVDEVRKLAAARQQPAAARDKLEYGRILCTECGYIVKSEWPYCQCDKEQT